MKKYMAGILVSIVGLLFFIFSSFYIKIARAADQTAVEIPILVSVFEGAIVAIGVAAAIHTRYLFIKRLERSRSEVRAR